MSVRSLGARVYFVRCEITGRVKIGTSTKLRARLAKIAAHSPTPVRIEASIPGSTALERALHARFRIHRLHGEWFSPAVDDVAIAIVVAELAPPVVQEMRVGTRSHGVVRVARYAGRAWPEGLTNGAGDLETRGPSGDWLSWT